MDDGGIVNGSASSWKKMLGGSLTAVLDDGAMMCDMPYSQ
jgi:hypothetical protein